MDKQVSSTRNRPAPASIGAVERETGLSKDTLRVWERRYGFPRPMRDGNGDRIYPAEQVERLRVIRRLIDQGMRPGRILSLAVPDLAKLYAKVDRPERAAAEAVRDSPPYLDLVKRHQSVELRRSLNHALLRQGVQRFVVETLAPLNVEVGEAWVRGDIAVFEEHLYTEIVQAVLRNAIAGQELTARAPKVLLTTLPNELHALGLLMAEAMLAAEGAQCIPLGPQLPTAEIVQAARAHRADVVALSFSAAYPTAHALQGLTDLRLALPGEVEVWAGGAAIERFKHALEGVNLMPALSMVPDFVALWRARHSR